MVRSPLYTLIWDQLCNTHSVINVDTQQTQDVHESDNNVKWAIDTW